MSEKDFKKWKIDKSEEIRSKIDIISIFNSPEGIRKNFFS